MVSPLNVWNFYAQYIDPIDFASTNKCSHLSGSLSYFSIDRRACNLAYSFILPFSAVSLALSSRWVELRLEQFLLQGQYYFVVLLPQLHTPLSTMCHKSTMPIWHITSQHSPARLALVRVPRSRHKFRT